LLYRNYDIQHWADIEKKNHLAELIHSYKHSTTMVHIHTILTATFQVNPGQMVPP